MFSGKIRLKPQKESFLGARRVVQLKPRTKEEAHKSRKMKTHIAETDTQETKGGLDWNENGGHNERAVPNSPKTNSEEATAKQK